jgi:hypothetical protein
MLLLQREEVYSGRGEREETGEEGGYHYMFISPPLGLPVKNPLPNKIRENVQNYEIGSGGEGTGGGEGLQIE